MLAILIIFKTITEALSRARDVAKALSDTSRLRILAALAERELCVCHFTSFLDVDASNVSRHVSILRRAGLITVRKKGRWLHCARAEATPEIWTLVDTLLAGAPETERDAEILAREASC